VNSDMYGNGVAKKNKKEGQNPLHILVSKLKSLKHSTN
jgi:hypothetical protein